MRLVGVSLQFSQWTCWTNSRSCGRVTLVVFITYLIWRDGGVFQLSTFLDSSAFFCGISDSEPSSQLLEVPRTLMLGSRTGPMTRSWRSRFLTNCCQRVHLAYLKRAVHLLKTWTSKSIKSVCEYYRKDPSREGTRDFCHHLHQLRWRKA